MSTIPSRFQQMPDPPADPIFGLKALFNQDERPHKLDLTAGVYKDEAGRTPAMDSVAAAQQHLVAAEQTKDYLPIAGDASYCESVGDLVLPGGPAGSWFHTPSGTAALALATRQLPHLDRGAVVQPDEREQLGHTGVTLFAA